MDMGKRFSLLWEAGCGISWKSLLREVRFLQFKKRLDKALRHTVWFLAAGSSLLPLGLVGCLPQFH